jgi:YHS domain-containing protein
MHFSSYRRLKNMIDRDPVCHMDVDPVSAAASSTYLGETYYFCSEDCKERFDGDPERYVARTEHSQT